MDLLRCPRCKNQMNPASAVCPVCGCRPKTEAKKTVAKWVFVALCSLWLANRYVFKLPGSLEHHHAGDQAMSKTVGKSAGVTR